MSNQDKNNGFNKSVINCDVEINGNHLESAEK